MANVLGKTDFNVGQDVSVTIQSDAGDNYSAEALGHLIDISLEREVNTIALKPISGGGRNLKMSVPQGYKGKISFARHSGVLAKMMLDVDNRWFTQRKQTKFTIHIQIQNRDGSVSSYLLNNAALGGGNILDAKNDKEIGMDFPFEAPECIVT